MIRYCFLSLQIGPYLPGVSALYHQAGWLSNAEDHSDLVAKIIKGSHCFLIAETGGQIIGMGRAISDRVSDAYIQDVTVAPAFRSQGIGTEIIQKIVQRLEQDGLKWIGLIAERNSQPFYEPLGFKIMPDATPMLNLRP